MRAGGTIEITVTSCSHTGGLHQCGASGAHLHRAGFSHLNVLLQCWQWRQVYDFIWRWVVLVGSQGQPLTYMSPIAVTFYSHKLLSFRALGAHHHHPVGHYYLTVVYASSSPRLFSSNFLQQAIVTSDLIWVTYLFQKAKRGAQCRIVQVKWL